MTLSPQSVVLLTDAAGHSFGRVTVQGSRGGLVLGKFAPGPDFAAVGPLFRELEEAANQQMLSIAEGLSAAIDALGLRLRSPEEPQLVEVHDVQVMNGQDFSCRLLPPSPGTKEEHPASAVNSALGGC